MPELSIRPAGPADLPVLVELAARTFRETYADLDTAEVEDYVCSHFSIERVRDWLDEPDARTLLACGKGGVAGYAQLRRAPAPACVAGPDPVRLQRLYLLAAVHGQGHGRALLQAGLAEARALGGRTVWLGVYDRNVRALAFYRRAGFHPVGTDDFVFGGRVYADPVLARSLDVGPAQRQTR